MVNIIKIRNRIIKNISIFLLSIVLQFSCNNYSLNNKLADEGPYNHEFCYPLGKSSPTPSSECLYDYKLKQSIINEFLDKGTPTTEPTMCIVAGCPGSGKSTMIHDFLNIDNYVGISVDDVIVKNPNFKKELKNAKTNEQKQQIYRKYRGNYGTGNGGDICDEILTLSIDKRCNIALETTAGTSSCEWIKNTLKNVKGKGYKTKLIVSIVPFKELIGRVKERENKTGQVPAPEDQIKASCIEMIDTLKALMASGFLDEVIVVENIKSMKKVLAIKKGKIIYCKIDTELINMFKNDKSVENFLESYRKNNNLHNERLKNQKYRFKSKL